MRFELTVEFPNPPDSPEEWDAVHKTVKTALLGMLRDLESDDPETWTDRGFNDWICCSAFPGDLARSHAGWAYEAEDEDEEAA